MGAQQSGSSTDRNLVKQQGVKEKSPTNRRDEASVKQACAANKANVVNTYTETETFLPKQSRGVLSGKKKACCAGLDKVTKDKGDLERASKTDKSLEKTSLKTKEAKRGNNKEKNNQEYQEKHLQQANTENTAAQPSITLSPRKLKYQLSTPNADKEKRWFANAKYEGAPMHESAACKTFHPTAIIKSMTPLATRVHISPKTAHASLTTYIGDRNEATSKLQVETEQPLTAIKNQTQNSILAETHKTNMKCQAQVPTSMRKCEATCEISHKETRIKLLDGLPLEASCEKRDKTQQSRSLSTSKVDPLLTQMAACKENGTSDASNPGDSSRENSHHKQPEEKKSFRKRADEHQKSWLSDGSTETSSSVDSRQVNVTAKPPQDSESNGKKTATVPVVTVLNITSSGQESSHSKAVKKKQNIMYHVSPNSAPARTENITVRVGIEKPHETLKRYLVYLNEADQYHLAVKQVEYWLLGRFLSNERVATNIIEKYRALGYGVERPQKMISYMLIYAFENLSPVAVSFLLSLEHRTFQQLWIPYGIKPYPALQLFFKRTKTFVKLVNSGPSKIKVPQEKKEESVNISKKSSSDDHKPAKNMMKGRVTIIASDEKHVQAISVIKGWDVLESKSSAADICESFKASALCGKLSGSNDKGYHLVSSSTYSESFAHQLALKAKGGRSSCSVPHIWSFAKTNAAGDTNEVAYDMEPLHKDDPYVIPTASVDLASILKRKGQCVNCWSENLLRPRIADCEKLVTRVLCLAHINTLVKRNQRKTEAGETEPYKKVKGKRAKKANAKVEDKEKGETVKCEEQKSRFDGHRECEMFRDELEKKLVTAVGVAVTVFPLLDETSGTRIFFSGENQKQNPKSIHQVFPLVLNCECSIKEKKSAENTSQFASRFFAKDQAHHHDSVVLDLLVPVHVKHDAGGEIANDTALLLRIVSRYVFQVRAEVFSLTGTRISDKAVEAHLRQVQSLCENSFRFIYFAEICGAAEMNMRGAAYLTTARSNYEDARDSAIEIGIYPTFVNMLNSEMAYLPSNLQFVKKPSMYLTALNFLNLRVPEITDAVVMNWLKDSQDDFVLEPIAVSMMETIAGKDYRHNIDDETAYKAMTGAGDRLGRGPAVALMSPVDIAKSESVFPPFEFDKSEFAAGRRSASQRLEIEERVKSLVQKVTPKSAKGLPLCEDIPRNIAEKADLESMDDVPIWKHLLDVAEEMQKKEIRSDVAVVTEQVKDGTANQSGERSGGQCKPPDVSAKPAELPKSSEDSAKPVQTHPGLSGEEAPQNDGAPSKTLNATEAQEAEKANGKEGTKRKKANREYLSAEKRKQRQAQRLREKWEKKHKADKKDT